MIWSVYLTFYFCPYCCTGSHSLPFRSLAVHLFLSLFCPSRVIFAVFYPVFGSGIIPDTNFSHPGSASKNLSILSQKIVSQLLIRVAHLESRGQKVKSSDSGAGSATLFLSVSWLLLASVLVRSLSVHLFLSYLSPAMYCNHSWPFSVPRLVLIVFLCYFCLSPRGS